MENLTRQQIIEGLSQKAKTNKFAADLLDGFNRWGRFTDKQRPWAEKLAREVLFPEIKQKTEGLKVGAGFARVNQMFLKARESGLKRPKIRLQDSISNLIEISFAPETGSNPGFIYIKSNKQYAGKISPDGEFFPVSSCSEITKNYLKSFSQNPLTVVSQYGRETGNCALCNRTLTKQESIDFGVGPICREKYGF